MSGPRLFDVGVRFTPVVEKEHSFEVTLTLSRRVRKRTTDAGGVSVVPSQVTSSTLSPERQVFRTLYVSGNDFCERLGFL